ncbi:uncharacterized protein J3R85_004878 [Psidium guajava]|nr:uncharacterized protein J3R85_004878 [Psidium guajava]
MYHVLRREGCNRGFSCSTFRGFSTKSGKGESESINYIMSRASVPTCVAYGMVLFLLTDHRINEKSFMQGLTILQGLLFSAVALFEFDSSVISVAISLHQGLTEPYSVSCHSYCNCKWHHHVTEGLKMVSSSHGQLLTRGMLIEKIIFITCHCLDAGLESTFDQASCV